MGISGFEIFIMSTVSPALLGIKSVRSTVFNNLRHTHLLSLAGLAAYLVEDPTCRLFAVGFGLAMACLGWAATLYLDSAQPAKLERHVLAWILGLLMSSVAKFGWHTNNPIWPIMH